MINGLNNHNQKTPNPNKQDNIYTQIDNKNI